MYFDFYHLSLKVFMGEINVKMALIDKILFWLQTSLL